MAILGVDAVLFLLIGLFGGAHCIGMCGPLVTIYAKAMDDQDVQMDGAGMRRAGHVLTPFQVRQHALFNLGRAASYTLIGSVLGGLGGIMFTSVDLVLGQVQIVRGGIGTVIGIGIMAIGISYVVGGTGVDTRVPGLDHVLGWIHAHVNRWASGPGIVGLGAVHGLIPCPILYPAYAFAFATGSALSGAVALAALGIGTIPAVFLYGTVISEVDVRHRRRLHRALGVAFLLLGYVLLAHGLGSLGIHVPHPGLPFWDPLSQPGPGH